MMTFEKKTTTQGQYSILKDLTSPIAEPGEFLDIIANAGARRLVLNREHFHPDFFDLKTRLAGEILQKCSNYGICLAIIGDFSQESSKSLRDFIYESNKTGQILFLDSETEITKFWK